MISGKTVIQLTDNAWEDQYPVWSPDGSKIAYMSNPDGSFDIYLMDASGAGIEALTSFEGDEETPAWFADSRHVAFTRNIKQLTGKKQILYSVDIETGSAEKIIPRFKRNHSIPYFSQGAPLMTFTAKRAFGWDVAVYDLRDHRIRFLEDGGKSCRARFSKDGNTLAYVSTRADGRGDIWLMNPDGSDKRRLTLRDKTHDYFPSWSPDGRKIVFCSSFEHDIESDWQILVYDVETGKTALLFDSPGSDIFPDWHE
jgi:Tol biopolymer transport system component